MSFRPKGEIFSSYPIEINRFLPSVEMTKAANLDFLRFHRHWRSRIWQDPKRCINAKPSIVAVFMTRTGATAGARYPRAPDLKTPRMNGAVRFAVPPKNASGRFQALGPSKTSIKTDPNSSGLTATDVGDLRPDRLCCPLISGVPLQIQFNTLRICSG